MRRVLLCAGLAVLAAMSATQARQSTLEMSCPQAAALVAAHGAVVLSTGRHTYDRFVTSRRYCAPNEYADRAWAPTRDGRCRLGFICRPGPPLFFDDDGLFGW